MRVVRYRGKWCAYHRIDGRPCRYSLGNLAATIENYPLAERAIENLVRQFATPLGNTLRDIMGAYLADSRALRKDRQETSWKALAPHFAVLTPEDITRDKCRTYARARRDLGRADGTIRKELTDLRAAVNWHDRHNTAVFELPAPPPPRDRWLTRDEFARLLDASAGTFHLMVFLHLAIATAGRKEAVLQITWPQIRWERNEIWLGVKPSGKKRATVPMTKTLRAVLQQAKVVSLSNHAVEFGGRPVKNIKTSFNKAKARAGLDDITIHDLRHTAGVWMVGAGVPMEKVSQFMGHSDMRVTERVYARYQPEHLKDAADALEV